MIRYHEKLKSFPIACVGAALGFISTSNIWCVHGIHFLKPLGIIFGLIALSLMLLKLILHPKQVWKELNHPVAASFYPTIDMILMSFCVYLLPYNKPFARTLWIISIIIHFSIFLLFFTLRFKNFKFKSILPSWNVVLVGYCTASAGSLGMGFPHIAEFLTYIALVLYIPFYPILIYRIYFFKPKIEVCDCATMGILPAASSLVLASYYTTSANPNILILLFLIITSILNVILIYIELPKFYKMGFMPGCAAFTFPLAISVIAMWKTNIYISKYSIWCSNLFEIISNIELIICSIVVLYVTINFIILGYKALVKR